MFDKLRGTARFAYAYLRLVRDPNRLDMVFALIDRVLRDEVPEPMASLPEVRAFLTRPPAPLRVDLDELSALPAGTLGRSLAAWMRERDLEPEALVRRLGDSDAERFKKHTTSTHDIWHVVTGFDTDVAGEVGLQAFYLAQLGAPAPMVLLSAVFLNTLFYARSEARTRMDAIVRGWLLGRRSKPLFGTDWRELWSLPLEEVRQSFGIVQADQELASLTRGAVT